jgi:hypothetical protein
MLTARPHQTTLDLAAMRVVERPLQEAWRDRRTDEDGAGAFILWFKYFCNIWV